MRKKYLTNKNFIHVYCNNNSNLIELILYSVNRVKKKTFIDLPLINIVLILIFKLECRQFYRFFIINRKHAI